MPSVPTDDAIYRTRLFSAVTRRLVEVTSSAEKELRSAIACDAVGRRNPRITDTRRAVEATMEAIVRALVVDEPLDANTIMRVRQLGGLLAEAGVAEKALASAVDIVASHVNALVLDEAEAAAHRSDTDAVAAVRTIRSVMKRHADVQRSLVQAVAEADVPGKSSKQRREVCVRLLTATSGDDGDIERRAKAAGVDLSHAWGAIVATPADPSSIREVLESSAEAFAADQPGAVVALVDTTPLTHAVVLVPAHPDGAWERARCAASEAAVQHGIFMLCYDPIYPPRGLAGRYVQAMKDLALPSAASLRPRALDGGHLALYRMCTTAPIEARYELVDRTIGRLLKHQQGRALVDTLEAMFAMGTNTLELAEQLGLHRNTVRNHIEAIMKLTGLNVERPEDLALLLVAVRLRHVVRN